jgi:hypothetical protein
MIPLTVEITEAEILTLREKHSAVFKKAELQAALVDHLVMGLVAHLPDTARNEVLHRSAKIVREITDITCEPSGWFLWRLLREKGIEVKENWSLSPEGSPRWTVERIEPEQTA